MKQPAAFDKIFKDMFAASSAAFGRLPANQRKAAVFAAGGGVVLLFVFAIYLPYRASISALEAKIAAKEKEVKADLAVVASRNLLEMEQAKYRAFLAPEMSENEENASLLKDIETFVKEAEVNLLTIKPTGAKQYEGFARKYSVALELEASMENLIKFLYAIEAARKPLTVEKYSIAPKSRDSNLARVSMTVSKMVVP